jgi:hypothetical protein
VSWQIANKRPEWRRVETETPLTYFDPDTGEIREHAGGFDGIVRSKDEAWHLLGNVAEALGPDVLRRWEDGDEHLDLAAEVAAMSGAIAGYRQVIAAGFGGTTTDMARELMSHMDPADVLKAIEVAGDRNPAVKAELAAWLGEHDFERQRNRGREAGA